MAPFKRTHGFQELDSLKAADYSSQTALALSWGNGQHCGDELRGTRLFDHGSPLRRQDQPINLFERTVSVASLSEADFGR